MWVWVKLKLNPKGDHTLTFFLIRTFFITFSLKFAKIRAYPRLRDEQFWFPAFTFLNPENLKYIMSYMESACI